MLAQNFGITISIKKNCQYGAYLAQLVHPQAYPAIPSTFKLCEFIFDEQSLFSLMFVVQPKYRLGDTLWYSWMERGVRRVSKVVKGFRA